MSNITRPKAQRTALVNPAAAASGQTSDAQSSRRSLLASLVGVVGAATLEACARGVGAAPEAYASVLEAASGSVPGAGQRYAETTDDLRQISAGSVGWIGVLLGSLTRGDGGGGVFYWDDQAAQDDGATVLNAGGLGSSSTGWRRLSARSQVFNVKDFGATGDGTTDDSAAVQLAADALPASGGTLYFPNGTYLLDAPSGFTISNKSRITLCGNGATLRRGTGDINYQVGYLNGCSDVLVTGLSFDLNGVGAFGGFNCVNCQRLRIENCSWFDQAFDPEQEVGIDHYAVVVQSSRDIWFTKNYVDRSKIEFNVNVGVSITDNTFNRAFGSAAIAIAVIDNETETFADYTIARNIVCDSGGDGIAFGTESGSTGVKVIERLHILDNLIVFKTTAGQNGLLLGVITSGLTTEFNDIIVRGNTIHYAAGLVPTGCGIAMFVEDNSQRFFNSRVEDNQVIGFNVDAEPARYAINLQFFVDGVVRNNRVLALPGGAGATYGMSTNNMQRCDIQDNLVMVASGGTTTAYRYVTSAGENTFENNRIIGTPSVPHELVAGSGDFISTGRWTLSQALPAIAIAGHSWQEQVITVSDAQVGDTVVAQPDGSPCASLTWSAYVASGGSVRVRLANPRSTAVTTTSRNWRLVLERWA